MESVLQSAVDPPSTGLINTLGSSRMKIAITMVNHPERMSGSVRLAFDEAAYLSDLGHEVWAIAPRYQATGITLDKLCGVNVLSYPQPELRPFDPRRAMIHKRLLTTALLKFVTSPFDIIHGHTPLQFDALIQQSTKSTRLVYSIHSPVRLEIIASLRHASIYHRLSGSIRAGLLNKIERRCLDQSCVLTAFSHYTKSLIEKIHGPESSEKIRVITGWVDEGFFQDVNDHYGPRIALNLPAEIPIFFSLRRLVPRMGLENLLKATARVKGSGIRFLLVIGGAGPLQETLERLAGALELNDCVRFVGYIPEAKLPLYYSAADAFVLPTAELECFGIIALEALACGCPVLANAVGSIPEILNNFERSWLTSTPDAKGVANLMLDFLNRKLPVHLGQELREKVISKYSKQKVLKELAATVLGSARD